MFETFEHTADIGIRVRAATLEGLLAEAARALFSVMVPNLDAVRPSEEITLELPPGDPEDLLHDWLSKLLVIFDTRHLVLSDFQVSLHSGGITATAHGERFDRQRHEAGMEVKAITYHQLKVVRCGPEEWLGEVILDI